MIDSEMTGYKGQFATSQNHVTWDAHDHFHNPLPKPLAIIHTHTNSMAPTMIQAILVVTAVMACATLSAAASNSNLHMTYHWHMQQRTCNAERFDVQWCCCVTLAACLVRDILRLQPFTGQPSHRRTLTRTSTRLSPSS